MNKLTKDSDGRTIKAGDKIRFSYGIPPVGVVADVVDRGGQLVALTPDHLPKECLLTQLRKHVGCFYWTPPKVADPREVEANIFAGRTALSGEQP